MSASATLPPPVANGVHTPAADPFDQTATSGGGNYTICPAGNHPAVLVGLIDLGTHNEEFKQKDGTSKFEDQRKVALVFELPGELQPDGAPYVLAKQLTNSFHENANLRKLIEGWRGRKFEDGEKFPLTSVLGKSCLLSVVHKKSGKGKDYADIAGVSAVPKGLTVPTAHAAPLAYSVAMGDPPAVDWLPFLYGEPMADVINRSRERRAQAAAPVNDDSDIPF